MQTTLGLKWIAEHLPMGSSCTIAFSFALFVAT
jgi:hypothetical protein